MGKRDALLQRNTINMLSEATESSDNIIDSIVENMEEENQVANVTNPIPTDEKKEAVEPINTPEPEPKVPAKQKKEVPKEKPAKKSSEIEPVAFKFNFDKKKEQRKTVHKNFLITEELNQKYVALAAQTGMNENQLFTSILEQMFNS